MVHFAFEMGILILDKMNWPTKEKVTIPIVQDKIVHIFNG
jgi:hypothetical protein